MRSLILSLLLISGTAYADEVITGFDTKDLPVLNEELRKINEKAIQRDVIRIGHTYAIAGEIAIPSGDTDFINPFFISIPTGASAKIVKATYKINSGTSATVKVQVNGSDATGYTGLSVTTTTASTSGEVSLSDGSRVAIVVTAVSGTPTNMSFTIFIEYTGVTA